ncbi:MAG: HAMP domain-containing sensor histidine kinase [Candidatus Kapabacteria bacterium]|nr:HAMP domain-containing sensor histidine kinase [Candidatus Kapabacteria bacterium]
MKNIYLSLFWKFTIGIIIIVAVFGTINILLINESVVKSLQSESEKRGRYIAINMANQALDPLLYEDYIALQKLVDNIHNIDSSVIYAFIEIGQKGDKIIHNFEEDVPVELLNANNLNSDTEFKVTILTEKNDKNKIIRDIAVPILNKNLGVVRIGILEDTISRSLNQTTSIFVLMVCIFLIFGVMGAFIFSELITRPIKDISKVAENFDLDSLRDIDKNNQILIIKRYEYSKFYIFDELDYFNDKFFSMIERLKEAYREIDKTYSKLIQSEKLASIGTLSAGIAHEINNPNTGIQYCLRIIKKDIPKNNKNYEYIELMEEASEKIERVVKGLLEYSRPQIIDFEDMNLCEVINKSIALLKYRIDRQNISILNHFSTDDHLIQGSSHFLEQVIVNLLINSIDAIEERKIVVPDLIGNISLQIERTPDLTELIISDNGIGIKQENLKDIYDPFYSSKEVGKGTGLGLTVCHKIVKLHHGFIFVNSSYGSGTTFKITLPNNNKV